MLLILVNAAAATFAALAAVVAAVAICVALFARPLTPVAAEVIACLASFEVVSILLGASADKFFIVFIFRI